MVVNPLQKVVNHQHSPPKSVGGTASRSEKTDLTVSAKAMKNLNQQYKSNGNINDFIALRTKQLNNR